MEQRALQAWRYIAPAILRAPKPAADLAARLKRQTATLLAQLRIGQVIP
jgi:hypothetical protein